MAMSLVFGMYVIPRPMYVLVAFRVICSIVHTSTVVIFLVKKAATEFILLFISPRDLWILIVLALDIGLFCQYFPFFFR